jgi:hypothetical protein
MGFRRKRDGSVPEKDEFSPSRKTMDLFYWLFINLLASTLSRLTDRTVPVMLIAGMVVGMWSSPNSRRERWLIIPATAAALAFVVSFRINAWRAEIGAPPMPADRWAFFIAGDCIVGIVAALITIAVVRSRAKQTPRH